MYSYDYSLLLRWAKCAKSPIILHMTESEVKKFAKTNNFAIYNVGSPDSKDVTGWRLYKIQENGQVGQLYYVIEKI